MPANPLQAYENASKSTISGRELEASVLTKAANRLKECREKLGSTEHYPELADALKYNRMIWSIFQAELSKPDNPLPQPLKEQILNLSLFADKKTLEMMAFPSPETLESIIRINLNIAAGLRGSAGI
ncbi:MAG: flagellar biosynthesis regulator FlaF [Desulfococcaceae bacterium]|jgi:flagellar protein FlaF|nr:flagellar biosynthesis regulator FlaF [Desulfococcaceae bacterium]